MMTALFALVALAQMPTQEEINAIAELVKNGQASYESLGWMGLAATLSYGALHLYRLEFFQSRLPRVAQWDAWKWYTKFGVVFFLAFVSTLLLAVAGGASLTVATVLGALVPSVVTGFGAIGTRQGLKAALPKVAAMGIRRDVNLKTELPHPEPR